MERVNVYEVREMARAQIRAAQSAGVTYADLVSAAGGKFSTNWVAGFAQGGMNNPTVEKLAALFEALELVKGRRGESAG